MFFVSLLLDETLGWTRSQSGTTSLRALLYMDEIFGYLPPVADPPSKRPLLTLLKQARAFGLGVVLATQNPVDLDYKGLANTGTWFIGRLQTERDKARVLEGLEGVAGGAGTAFDRAAMEQLLAGLGSRDLPAPQRPRRRAGGLRDPVGDVVPARPDDPPPRSSGSRRSGPPDAPAQPAGAPAAAATGHARAGRPPPPVAAGPRAAARPLLPPAVPQFFLPLRGAAGGHVYQPALAGVDRDPLRGRQGRPRGHPGAASS